MTEFDLNDDELNDILGLSSEKAYIPTFIAKPLKESLKEDLSDSLSSVEDFSQDDALMANDLLIKNSDNVEMDHNTKKVDQIERILVKLEENTTKVNGMNDRFQEELHKREENIKMQQEQLDIKMKQVEAKYAMNAEKESKLFELESALKLERLDLNSLKEKYKAQREQDQFQDQKNMECHLKELENKSQEMELERTALKALEEKLLMKQSNLDLQISNENKKLERERIQFELDRKIQKELENEAKTELRLEYEGLRSERLLFEKEHSTYLIKLKEYHVKNNRMKLERQELDSLEIELKAEKEILSLKESEISDSISKLNLLKREVARERETISKLVKDNTALVNMLEGQKISIENIRSTLLLDRANALQNRLDCSHDLSHVEALRQTSLVPKLSCNKPNTIPNRVNSVSIALQRENLIRQKRALASL